MTRERTFTEQARRRQIVDAAIDVIAEEGFRAASVARIAQRAGVSKALVLYHFDSKDDLLRQSLFETVGALAQEALSGVDLTGEAPKVLRALVRRSAQVGIERARERRALEQIVANLGPGAPGDPVLSVQDAEPLLAGLEQMFIMGKKQGTFRADLDTRVMAVTYQAAVDAMHRHIDAHPDADVDAYADALADILLSGTQVPGS